MLRQFINRLSPINISAIPSNGTYRGRLKSAEGKVLEAEFRIELDSNNQIEMISADFFRQNIYYGSLQAQLKQDDGILEVNDLLFIFDEQKIACAGGEVKLDVQSAQAIAVTCIIPEATPEEYTGIVSFTSPYFRVLKIEIDKLKGNPWPPKFYVNIPPNEQPDQIQEQLYVSIEEIFRRAGMDTHLRHSNSALKSKIAEQRTKRPGEEDEIRWDERELHEMMQAHFSRKRDAREWWTYLLIASRYDGGISIDKENEKPVIDSQTGHFVNKGDGTLGIMFDTVAGNVGSLVNLRPRQGAAIFWKTIERRDDSSRNRDFLHTLIHELGHVLNLPHAWKVDRSKSLSFMNSPFWYKSPSNFGSYWESFKYTFDPEELFHIHHGFYNEVVPGGNLSFLEWTFSSGFNQFNLGKNNSSLLLTIEPTRPSGVFRFTEPVTVEVTVENRSSQNISIGNLSPAYGDLRFFIRKPNDFIEEYKTPLSKCAESSELLSPQTSKKHLVSLAVNANGFTFDTPGQYDITATFRDPSNQKLVIAPLVSITIKPPDRDDDEIVKLIYGNSNASLFFYMGGGNHLETAKKAFEDIVDRYPDCSMAAYANLVLGLNELAGQKRVTKPRVESNKDKAAAYFEAALKSNKLPKSSQKRLRGTRKLCQ